MQFIGYLLKKNEIVIIRYRSIGLHVLQGIVLSNALNATDAEIQLQYVVPALLQNLTDDKVGLEAWQKM